MTRERPPWRWWFGPVGFVAAIATVTLVAALVAAIAGLDGDPPPQFTLGVTLVQDLVFVATAIAFATLAAPPRGWQFGLRPVPFKKALGWTVAAAVTFYALTALYSAAAQPDGRQSVVQDLGANDSTTMLVAAALLVVGLAPFAEEFFFRAFFYGALRTRLGVPLAAGANGLLFGAIHYSGPDTLSILPPLALLGVLFCLLYEKTGSLYPVIAFHAFNNAVALSLQVGEGWPAPLIVGALSIAACGVLTGRRAHPPDPVEATGA